MERRIVDAQMEVQAEGEKPRRLVGYASVFDQLSVVIWGFREKVAKGAFAGTVGDDIRALWNHDTAYVLGRTTAGTLTLGEDDHGLWVEITPPDTPLAQSFLASVERGDVSQMSIGFNVLEDTWDEDDEGQMIRTVTKIKLYEVSPVTFPAYPQTEIGLRSDAERAAIFGDNPVRPGMAATNNESDRRAPVEIERTAAALRAQAEARARRMRLAQAKYVQEGRR